MNPFIPLSLLLTVGAAVAAKKAAAPAATPALAASADARPGLQSRYVQALVELSAEACDEEGGRIALKRHEWNLDALHWAEKTTHPSECTYFSHAAVDVLRFGARLAQPGVPAYDKAKEAELASYELLSDEAATAQAVRAVLGADLVTKAEPVASGGVFVRYNPQALEAALSALYVKPDEARAGFAMQQLYDLLLKRSVGEFAESAARVLQKKELFQAKAKTFAAKLRDPLFYPMFFASEYATTLTDELGADAAVDPQVVGTLLRRSTDGTLPVILKGLRQVLQDYDPPRAAKLNAQLQP